MGDFVIFLGYFFRISSLEGFLYSVPPRGDLKEGSKSVPESALGSAFGDAPESALEGALLIRARRKYGNDILGEGKWGRTKLGNGRNTEKKKAYTTTTERKSFGELFWPQRKIFQAGGGYEKPYKNQENHIHHRNLSSVDPIFPAKKSSALEQGGVCFLFPRNTVSRVLFRRRELTEPHWILRQTRWVLRQIRWVCVYTQIIGWEELTEFAPRNSVSPQKLTEFGVWSRTPRNRIRPVSEKYRRIPKCEGDKQGQIPKVFPPQRNSLK